MSKALTVKVLGSSSDQVELPEELFGLSPNVALLHQVVVAQQAAGRAGTHATKTRSLVSGTGAKPWRQKGTGRARHGSRISPQWTGGGIAHGPQPRSYAQRTPKKMIRAALRQALSDRANEDLIFVVDEVISGDKPSTKAAAQLLAKVGDYKRYLVVLDREDEAGWLSVRNLAGVHALSYDQLNAYDVLVADAVIFTKAAIEAFIAGAQASGNDEEEQQ